MAGILRQRQPLALRRVTGVSCGRRTGRSRALVNRCRAGAGGICACSAAALPTSATAIPIHARDREHDREHLYRKTHGLVDETRIEVDIGIELAADEVVVGQRDLFELERDVEQRVLARHLEDFIGGVFDDLGPRVIALVDAMTEAHESATALLDAADEIVDAVVAADLGEHVEHGFVGAAVTRSVQPGAGGRHGRIGVGVRRTHDASGSGRAVLLVVGMQDEQDVERTSETRIALESGLRDLEHHRQEIGGEVDRVVGIDERHPHAESVCCGGERGQFRDESHHLLHAVISVVDVFRLGIERRQCCDRRHQHAHGVRVVVETFEKSLADVFVDVGVIRDLVHPRVILLGRRQLAMDQ